MSRLRPMSRLATACVCVLTCAPAAGAEYPSRPVRMIVPFVAGGGTDLLARFIAPRLGELLSQQIVVDNRGGGGSVVGSQIVAKAVPDGYTLGLFDTAFAINPAVIAKLPYESERDFAPIAVIAINPSLLVTHPGLKARSIQDLIEIARNSPGKVKFASAGIGSSSHLSGEMLALAAKVKLVHVPFKGAGASIIDVLGGHTDLTFVVPGTVRQHLQSGALIGLAVTGSKPAPTLPDVPTFAGVGLPSVDTSSFRFLVAPARVPAPVQGRLATLLRKVMDAADLQKLLVDNGYDPVFIAQTDARAFIIAETRKWQKAVQDAGVKPN